MPCVGSELDGACASCVWMSEITLLYCVVKVLIALVMFVAFGAGAPTLTVIGPLVVVTPVSVSVTPPIALVTVLEDELPLVPSTLNSASCPALADCRCQRAAAVA